MAGEKHINWHIVCFNCIPLIITLKQIERDGSHPARAIQKPGASIRLVVVGMWPSLVPYSVSNCIKAILNYFSVLGTTSSVHNVQSLLGDYQGATVSTAKSTYETEGSA